MSGHRRLFREENRKPSFLASELNLGPIAFVLLAALAIIAARCFRRYYCSRQSFYLGHSGCLSAAPAGKALTEAISMCSNSSVALSLGSKAAEVLSKIFLFTAAVGMISNEPSPVPHLTEEMKHGEGSKTEDAQRSTRETLEHRSYD